MLFFAGQTAVCNFGHLCLGFGGLPALGIHSSSLAIDSPLPTIGIRASLVYER